MAVTLIDYFKQAKSPQSLGFISDLLREWDPAGEIPWVGVDGLKVTGNRWQTLPATAGRKIGAGYTESSGTTEEIGDTLFAVGGDVKIDRLLTKAKNMVQDPLTTQMQMKAKSMMFTIANSFINGNLGVDPDLPEGLKTRVSNMPARQTLDMFGIDVGDGYPILKDSTHWHTFLDYLHKAVRFSSATHIFANETALLGIGQLLRRIGSPMLGTWKNQYDVTFDSFAGRPIMDIGLKSDKSTEIITNTEDPGDGGNDCTSLYAVYINKNDGFHGLQLNGTSPDPYDPLTGGEMEGGPQFLRRIDWAIGFWNLSQYCIVRLKGFRVAAV